MRVLGLFQSSTMIYALLVWTIAALGVCTGSGNFAAAKTCKSNNDCQFTMGETCDLASESCECKEEDHFMTNPMRDDAEYQIRLKQQGNEFIPECVCAEGYQWSNEGGNMSNGRCCRDAIIEQEYIVAEETTTLTCKLKVNEPEVSSFEWSGIQCDETPNNTNNCTFTPTEEDSLKLVQCNVSDCSNFAPSIRLAVNKCPNGFKWSNKSSAGKCCRDATIEHKPIYEAYDSTLMCKLKVDEPPISSYRWSGIQCQEKPNNNSKTCTFTPKREDFMRRVQCHLPDCSNYAPSILLSVYHVSQEVPKITGYNGTYRLRVGSNLTMNCTVEGGHPLVDVNFTCPGVPDSKDYKGSNYSVSMMYLENITRFLNGKDCSCFGTWMPGNAYNWKYTYTSSVKLKVLKQKSDFRAIDSEEDDDVDYGYFALLFIIPGVALVAVSVRKYINHRKSGTWNDAHSTSNRPDDEEQKPPLVEQTKMKQPLVEQPTQPVMKQHLVKQPTQPVMKQPLVKQPTQPEMKQHLLEQPTQPVTKQHLVKQPTQPVMKQPLVKQPSQPEIKQPLKEQPTQSEQPLAEQPTQPEMKQPLVKQPTQPEIKQPLNEQPTQSEMQQPLVEQPTQPETKQPTQPEMKQPLVEQPTQPEIKEAGKPAGATPIEAKPLAATESQVNAPAAEADQEP